MRSAGGIEKEMIRMYTSGSCEMNRFEKSSDQNAFRITIGVIKIMI
jgi:hypothetical protein